MKCVLMVLGSEGLTPMMSNEKLELLDTIEDLEVDVVIANELLKNAYDEGRKYPHDEAGSSFDRWFKSCQKVRSKDSHTIKDGEDEDKTTGE